MTTPRLTAEQRIELANKLERLAFAYSSQGKNAKAARAWKAADRIIFNRLLNRA